MEVTKSKMANVEDAFLPRKKTFFCCRHPLLCSIGIAANWPLEIK
jgi:hypothetical protein